MKLKLISCDVFLRETCAAIVGTKNIISPEFTPKGAHDEPGSLRELIQSKIDGVEDENEEYDAIVLAYGLCGNGTAGLKARSIPLIIPRAHDCCTIFLGSKEKFMENFKDNLSARWSSAGYMDRGDYLRDSDMDKLLGKDIEYQEYVKLYGEENAQFIWETLHPKVEQSELIFINTAETEHLDSMDRFKERAQKNGKTVRILEGDSRLLKGLINGEWDETEFLIVPPGKTIKAVYDHEKVIEVE